MAKKLIVIEGTDGSGKETQTKLLLERLQLLEEEVYLQSFPNYHNDGCEPTKMYLNGELGELNTISPYAASTLFAVDRYTTLKTVLIDVIEDKETILLFDRYTTSNMIYQACKLENRIDSINMVDWISDLEYNKMKMPRPDVVVFLDMPPWASKQLRAGRLNKITGDSKQDIHESDEVYLEKVYSISKEVAIREGWKIIRCTNADMTIKTIREINDEILRVC